MKVITTAVVLSFALIGASAQAADMTKSRDQVRQELAESKSNGTYSFGELAYVPKAQSGRSIMTEPVNLRTSERAVGSFGDLDYPRGAVPLNRMM
ncbi:MAG: DUF4148 domain-containing protein [Achromobacter sp.]|jgi:hypothetical protein